MGRNFVIGSVLAFLEEMNESSLRFRGLTFDFFISSVHFLYKKEIKFRYLTAKVLGPQKRDRLLVSKVEFIFLISQRNKNFTY